MSGINSYPPSHQASFLGEELTQLPPGLVNKGEDGGHLSSAASLQLQAPQCLFCQCVLCRLHMQMDHRLRILKRRGWMSRCGGATGMFFTPHTSFLTQTWLYCCEQRAATQGV